MEESIYSQLAEDRVFKGSYGFRHHRWKGDNVGIGGVHDFMKKRFILKYPKICNKCKSTKNIDLSNNSGKYKREMNDWEWLCRSCHSTKDNKVRFLRK